MSGLMLHINAKHSFDQFCMFLLFYVAGVCLAYRWFSYLGRSQNTALLVEYCQGVICCHLSTSVSKQNAHYIYLIFF